MLYTNVELKDNNFNHSIAMSRYLHKYLNQKREFHRLKHHEKDYVFGWMEVTTDDNSVKAAVEKIIAEHFEENNNIDVYKFLFNTIDLTTLNATDSNVSVSDFVERVNKFDE